MIPTPRYLLDTHTFLWMRHAPDRLGAAAREICGDVESSLHLSLASSWELAVKLSLGKLELADPLRLVLEEARTRAGIAPLSITEAHVLRVEHLPYHHRVEHLPYHHRDPFDRMLVAQAMVEGLTLLSKNSALDAYDIERVW